VEQVEPGFAVVDEGGLAVAWQEFTVRTAKSSMSVSSVTPSHEGIFPPTWRSVGSPMTYRRLRIRIQKHQGFAEPECKSIKASPNPDVFRRLRRMPRSTLGKPSGDAKTPVTGPSVRAVFNWDLPWDSISGLETGVDMIIALYVANAHNFSMHPTHEGCRSWS